MATATTVTIDGNTYVVLRDGYRPWRNKAERVTQTSSGKHDVVMPSSGQQGWSMVLKCTYAELQNLITSWDKKTTITFVDHLNNSHTVYCLGELSEATLVPVLDGSSSLYHVPVRLLKKNA